MREDASEWFSISCRSLNRKMYRVQQYSLTLKNLTPWLCQLFRTHGRFVPRPFVTKLRWFVPEQLVVSYPFCWAVGIRFHQPKQRFTCICGGTLNPGQDRYRVWWKVQMHRWLRATLARPGQGFWVYRIWSDFDTGIRYFFVPIRV